MKTIYLFALISGLSVVQAYIIDNSCKPWSKQFETAVPAAFRLANSAKLVFTGLKPNGQGAEWEAQRDLVEYMFARTLTNNQPDPDNGQWRLAQRVYEDVLSFVGQKSPPENWRTLADSSEIVIYCDFEHWDEGKDDQGNEDSSKVREKNLGFHINFNDEYKRCKFGETDPKIPEIEALTANPAMFGDIAPSAVQICTNYLKRLPKDMTLGSDKGVANSFAKGLGALRQWARDAMGIRTEIDALATFESLLLHEFVHCVPRNPPIDVNEPNSYGWTNCRGFSGTRDTENADNYALFALGAQMIAPLDGSKPTRLDEDGQIFDLYAPPQPGRLRARRPQKSIAIPMAQTTLNIEASNRTNFTIPVATGAETVSAGGCYVIGTHFLSVETSDIIYDQSTIAFPSDWLATGSTLQTVTRSNATSSPTGTSLSTTRTALSTTTNKATITGSSPSQTATTSGSSSGVPIVVVNISRSGTTTPVTYVSTQTSSGSIGPTGAWMCTGPLCDKGSKCVVPLFCKDRPGSGSSWGLCCGWTPPAGGSGGSGPQPGGPDPPPKPPSNDPSSHSQESQTPDQSTTQSTSLSSPQPTRSATTSSSASCSTTMMTACDTTISVYKPSRASTAITSTVTGKCSTTSACSGSLNGSSTSTTSHKPREAVVFADSFPVARDPKAQQAIISAAKADTTDAEITWTGSSQANSTASSSTTSETAPPSSSSSTSAPSSNQSSSTLGPSPTSTSTQAIPPSSATSLGPAPTESCHTQYKLFFDSFDIYGRAWDQGKLDGGGGLMSGAGLLSQLRGCSEITAWEFEKLTVSGDNPYEWHAYGQSTIWQKDCIMHAMVSAGAPDTACDGTG